MNNKLAFTLIELLVVIAVIGILSGLIVVSMNGTTDKAIIAKAQIFSNSLRNSLMSNLVSEWKLDGDANDSWNGGNNGTITGATTNNTNCIFGSCLDFDGIDDYVNIVSGTNLNFGDGGPFTVTLWVKSNVFKSQAPIILKKVSSYIFNSNAGWGIQFASNPQKIYMGIANGTANIQYYTGLDVFDWTLLGMTRMSDGKVYFIKNGSMSLTGTLTGVVDNSSDIFLSKYATYYFNGSIDDIRIYNSSISISEIKEQYFSGLNSLLFSKQIDIKEYGNRVNLIAINE